MIRYLYCLLVAVAAVQQQPAAGAGVARAAAVRAPHAATPVWSVSDNNGAGRTGAADNLVTDTVNTPIAAADPAEAGDEIWMVSTRRLPTAINDQVSPKDLVISCLTSTKHTGDIFSAAPGLVTCIYVHGNRIEQSEELDRGLTAYRALKCGGSARTPLRFVIWSWPSDEVHGAFRDARTKAARTNAEAFYLGSFLAAQPAAAPPVRLLGYSFGARIVTGALHLVGGGQLAGHRLPLGYRSDFRARVALIAAAVDNEWLLPGHPHGQALTAVEKLFLLNNSQDRALRFYHVVLEGRALGFTGLRSVPCPQVASIQQQDYHAYVGKLHDINRYFRSPLIAAKLATFLLP